MKYLYLDQQGTTKAEFDLNQSDIVNVNGDIITIMRAYTQSTGHWPLSIIKLNAGECLSYVEENAQKDPVPDQDPGH